MGLREWLGLTGPELVGAVLYLVEITNAVALVVAGLTDQPGEDVASVERVSDAGVST